MFKRSMGIQIAVFVLVVSVMVGWSYFHMRNQASYDEPGGEPDLPTIVDTARAAHPGLSFVPGRDRSPQFYRVKELATGREAEVPNAELKGAKIRFVECDLASIPAALLYPHRSRTACLELRNDKHALQAYSFATTDGWSAQIAFFELNIAPELRIGAPTGRSDSTVTRRLRDSATGEFLVSFMLGDDGGFVAYKEEKIAAAIGR